MIRGKAQTLRDCKVAALQSEDNHCSKKNAWDPSGQNRHWATDNGHQSVSPRAWPPATHLLTSFP